MQRWRKPPILALAYISPARSSKRRMRNIFWRTVRQVSLSGRPCLTSPKPISSSPTTSLGLWPSVPPPSPFLRCGAPSPDWVASLVAIGPESTHTLRGSIADSPGWGEAGVSLAPRVNPPPTRLRSHMATPTPTLAAAPTATCSARSLDALRNRTRVRLRSGEGGGRLLEAVVAPEELVADGDGGDAADAAVVRLLSSLAELVFHRLGLERLEDRVWMELAGGCRHEHVVDVREVLASRERLAERGERECDGAPDRLGEDGRPHGLEGVVGPALGPPDRHEPVLGGPSLDLRLALVPLISDAPRAPTGLLPDAAEEDRLPHRHDRQDPLKPLSGQIRIRRPKVVIENRLLHGSSV